MRVWVAAAPAPVLLISLRFPRDAPHGLVGNPTSEQSLTKVY
jgi:hypothetical protein